jgi:osmotically-inducible protein OsmY
MIRSLSALAIGFALTWMLGGCQSMTGKTAGRNIDDTTITATVQSKLTQDRMSNFAKVDVDTERGVVNLNGVVKSADQKARAAQLASQVEGVRRVNNQLQVQSMRP